LTRVRKKTFWILTFLVPVFYAGIIGLSVFLAENPMVKKQKVTVVDYSGLFDHYFQNTESIEFLYSERRNEKKLTELLKDQTEAHVLIIPEITNFDTLQWIDLRSSKNSGSFVGEEVNKQIAGRIKDEKIKKLGLDKLALEKLEPIIYVNVTKITESGAEKDNTLLASIIAAVAAFLNYMFVFIYGNLVLRGVHEEKQNRIVELIVSSVRPFELMFGKIIGVALVGLTQFFLWVSLISLLTVFGLSLPGLDLSDPGNPFGQLVQGMDTIPFGFILFVFLFYFIGGYLLYSSLFASIAAAVDNQADMQQFTLPVSLPLIVSIISIQAVLQSPNSMLAIWLSWIPFTSPVIMVARATFGVPWYELAGSMTLLVASFLATTWFAARIYRIGILLHGAKITYNDLWKWLFYK